MTTKSNTATHCHCGREWSDSDHCKYCGCEEYESYCNETAPTDNSEDDF